MQNLYSLLQKVLGNTPAAGFLCMWQLSGMLQSTHLFQTRLMRIKTGRHSTNCFRCWVNCRLFLEKSSVFSSHLQSGGCSSPMGFQSKMADIYLVFWLKQSECEKNGSVRSYFALSSHSGCRGGCLLEPLHMGKKKSFFREELPL